MSGAIEIHAKSKMGSTDSRSSLSAEKHIYVLKTQLNVCNLSGISKKQILKSSVTGRQVVVKAIPSLLEVFTTFTDSDEPDSCTEAFLVDTRYVSQHLSFKIWEDLFVKYFE